MILADHSSRGPIHAVPDPPSQKFSLPHAGCYPTSLRAPGKGLDPAKSLTQAGGRPSIGFYSLRSAVIGEMDAARLAGIIAAKNAAKANAPEATMRANGSQLVTP